MWSIPATVPASVPVGYLPSLASSVLWWLVTRFASPRNKDALDINVAAVFMRAWCTTVLLWA
jgi:hypothetical protein